MNYRIILLIMLLTFGLIYSCNNNLVVTASNGKIQEAWTKLYEAYNSTVQAEGKGADITEPLDNLNNALEYIIDAENLASQGETEQIEFLANASIELSDETIRLNQELKKRAEDERFSNLIIRIIVFIVLVIVAVYTFFLGRRLLKKREEKKLMEMKIVLGGEK